MCQNLSKCDILVSNQCQNRAQAGIKSANKVSTGCRMGSKMCPAAVKNCVKILVKKHSHKRLNGIQVYQKGITGRKRVPRVCGKLFRCLRKRCPEGVTTAFTGCQRGVKGVPRAFNGVSTGCQGRSTGRQRGVNGVPRAFNGVSTALEKIHWCLTTKHVSCPQAQAHFE